MADLLIIGAIALAALVQGYGGFGFGIVAVTLLALCRVPLESASAVVTVLATLMVACLLKLSWRDAPLDWPNLGRLFAGALIGLPLGYLFIVRYGEASIGRLVLGCVLLAFGMVGLLVDPVKLRLPHWTGWPFGFLSGFTGGAFVTGGPPVVIYLYGRAEGDPRDMKPTIQFIFLAVCLLRLSAAATSSVLLEGRVLALSGASLPLAAVMLWVGHWLSRYGSVRTFRFAVQSLIGAFGVGLILLNWPGTT